MISSITIETSMRLILIPRRTNRLVKSVKPQKVFLTTIVKTPWMRSSI
jgi:hypothetical protein